MAWNEPGNSGKDPDPWGKSGRNSNKVPPDLDKVLRNLLQKLSGLLGGRRPGGDVSAVGMVVVLLIALVVWAVSGFYTIKEAEQGVVLRFGKYYEKVGPGLNWKMTFIDQVIPVDIETVRVLSASGSMLTQDENVVRVEMDVQYRVADPRQYLFSVTNADDSLRQATDSALRYVVGHTSMDEVLTRGREKVRQDTWQVLEQITDPYQMGIMVVDVNFLPARPPEEVKDAFDDAISAQEDEQRFIREAEAYAREIEPKARGQVKRLEEDALAYKEQTVLKANGEVARFNQLLPQYLAAPDLTRQRLYIETMEEIYQKANKVIIDLPEGNNNVLYLPLDKFPQGSAGKRAVQPAPVMGQSSSPESVPSEQVQPEGSNSSSTPLRSNDRFSTRRY